MYTLWVLYLSVNRCINVELKNVFFSAIFKYALRISAALHRVGDSVGTCNAHTTYYIIGFNQIARSNRTGGGGLVQISMRYQLPD
jgi:hypothetical protein